MPQFITDANGVTINTDIIATVDKNLLATTKSGRAHQLLAPITSLPEFLLTEKGDYIRTAQFYRFDYANGRWRANDGAEGFYILSAASSDLVAAYLRAQK